MKKLPGRILSLLSLPDFVKASIHPTVTNSYEGKKGEKLGKTDRDVGINHVLHLLLFTRVCDNDAYQPTHPPTHPAVSCV